MTGSRQHSRWSKRSCYCHQTFIERLYWSWQLGGQSCVVQLRCNHFWRETVRN